MLESRSLPGPRRWPAALLLAAALLFAGGVAPLAAQEAEEPAPPAAEPAEPAAAPAAEDPVPAEPPAPAAPEEADPPAEMEPVEEIEEDRPERERRSHRHRQRRKDAQVVVGSSLVVEEDETSNDVVVIGGSLTVLGDVYGDAAAIGGSVFVGGRVTGDVAAVGGSVTVDGDAEVMGGAMSFGGSVVREEGGVVHGEVVEVSGSGVQWAMWPRLFQWRGWGAHDSDWFDHSPFDWALSQAWRIFMLCLLVLVAFLALLVARTPIERIGRRVEAEPWKSGLVGLASQILFVPLLLILVFFLAVSIIGIPFLFLVPFALIAIAIAIFLGYVGVALKLGDLLRERFGWSIQSPYMVLLVGILGLRIWSLIGQGLDFNGPPLKLFAALFLLFGFLVGYAAWTLATGGAVLTRFGTAESWSRRPPAPPSLPAAASPAPSPAAPPAAEPPEAAWEPELDPGEGRGE